MTLANYVKLERDREKVLRIRAGSFRLEDRTITDPVTKQSKVRRAAVVDVVSEDGVPVSKTFSTLSEKLASSLSVLHDNGTLYTYSVAITMTGEGFATEYQLRLF